MVRAVASQSSKRVTPPTPGLNLTWDIKKIADDGIKALKKSDVRLNCDNKTNQVFFIYNTRGLFS